MNDFACEGGEKLTDGDGKTLGVDRNPQNQSTWISVRRYVGAFFIYLIYLLTLLSAFKQTLGPNLSLNKAQELVDEGVIDSISEYGWGDHYIFYFISFCFSVFCSAVLSGATAKKRGGIIASIANIPMFLILGLVSYLFFSGKIHYESQVPWGIVLVLSLISSCYIAFKGGQKGEQWQNKTFSNDTMFGIRPIHWWWLIFPINFSILTIVPKIIITLPLLFSSASVSQTKYAVLLFLFFVAIVTSIYIIIWGWYKAILSLSVNNTAKSNKIKTALYVLFYLFGIPILADLFLALIILLFR